MPKSKPNGYWEKELKKLITQETNNCLVWNGPNTRGYGRIFYNGKWHRAGAEALEAHNIKQTSKDKSYVLHKPKLCHNPKCVNYRHLYWGDHQDNMSDKFLDKTTMKGELHPRAKLTDAQALTIRNSSEPDLQLSRKYGVDRKVIWSIKHNKIWRNA